MRTTFQQPRTKMNKYIVPILLLILIFISAFILLNQNKKSSTEADWMYCNINNREVKMAISDCLAIHRQNLQNQQQTQQPIIIQRQAPPPIQIPRIKNTTCWRNGQWLNCTEY